MTDKLKSWSNLPNLFFFGFFGFFLRHSVTMDIIHKYRKQPRVCLNNTVDF